MSYLSIGLSVGLAVSVMMITKTIHPPAGANPIIIMLGNEGFSFLIMPISAGAAILVFIRSYF